MMGEGIPARWETGALTTLHTEPGGVTCSEPVQPRGFWGRLKSHILHPELTPRQIAWSFGIGFCIAWNPLLGLHTWMVLLLCLLFRRLHRPLMLIAAFLNNPWTMVPIATASAYAGNILLGRGLSLNLAGIRWGEIGWRSFATREGAQAMYAMLKPILAPYLLGGFVLSLLALPLGYWLMLIAARKLRAMHFDVSRLHVPHLHKDH